MRLVFSALAGAVFGLGLWLSGMTDTTKVQGWLDVAGNWDPTLAFVLSGAIIPMLIAWQVAARRERAVLGTALPVAPEPVIDGKLLLGSGLFGIGWALSGLCPGPAMASLGFGGLQGVVFMVALLVGMIGYARVAR